MKNQAVQPFKKIDDIEEDIQKFLHLGGMDTFMINNDIINFILQFLPYEKKSE